MIPSRADHRGVGRLDRDSERSCDLFSLQAARQADDFGFAVCEPCLPAATAYACAYETIWFSWVHRITHAQPPLMQ